MPHRTVAIFEQVVVECHTFLHGLYVSHGNVYFKKLASRWGFLSRPVFNLPPFSFSSLRRHSKRQKKSMSKRQNQISFLAQSSSILSKLATIIKTNPTILFHSTSGNRVSKRILAQKQDHVARLIKRAHDSSLVLLTMVCSIEINLL
jgi:hypothetical protein